MILQPVNSASRSWASVVTLINDPEHWRARAKETRDLAAQEADKITKEMILQIAAEYDRLAERALERLKPQG